MGYLFVLPDVQNITAKKDRLRVVLDEIPDASEHGNVSHALISSVESKAVDSNIDSAIQRDHALRPAIADAPMCASDVSSVLLSVSPTLEPYPLFRRLEARAELSAMQVAIGATTCTRNPNEITILDNESCDVVPENGWMDDTTENYPEGDGLSQVEWIRETIVSGCIAGEISVDEVMQASATHASSSRYQVDAEHLAKVWRIDLETARRTLDATTQSRTYTANENLPRNFGTNDRMLRYKRIKEFFYMDTFFATKKAGKSSRGHVCCQLFVTDKGFIYVVPMTSKSEVFLAVKQFCKEIGAPEAIICDPAREQTSQELRKFLNEAGSTLRALEEGTPWSNRAELYIGLLKEAVLRDMKDADSPLAFWDYCVERRARINNLTAKGLFQLHGTTPHTATFHEDSDISSLCKFGWYEWCYYREQTAKFPFAKEVLGRVLGPAKTDGNEMAQWILKANGYVVPRRSARPLTIAEKTSETEIEKRRIFVELIKRRWGTSINPPPDPVKESSEEDKEFEEFQSEDEPARIVPDVEDTVDSKGQLINQQPIYDQLINAEVQLQLGDQMSRGIVRRRATGPDGRAHGVYDSNPIRNSIVYEVEFPDGQVKEYAANVIAENILARVDQEGYSITMMEGIIDYEKDEAVAVSKADRYVVTRRGNRRARKSTVGWKLPIYPPKERCDYWTCQGSSSQGYSQIWYRNTKGCEGCPEIGQGKW